MQPKKAKVAWLDFTSPRSRTCKFLFMFHSLPYYLSTFCFSCNRSGKIYPKAHLGQSNQVIEVETSSPGRDGIGLYGKSMFEG
jgi:hypothetical protein